MSADPASSPNDLQTCDFCGKPAARVRRVVLDGDYERLRTPHTERFACPDCSEAKEKQRLGLDRT